MHQSFGSCGLDSFVLFSSVGSSWGKSVSVSVSMIRFVPMVAVRIFKCLRLSQPWKHYLINRLATPKLAKVSCHLSLSLSYVHILERPALLRNAIRLSNLLRFQRFLDFLAEQLMQKTENVSASRSKFVLRFG